MSRPKPPVQEGTFTFTFPESSEDPHASLVVRDGKTNRIVFRINLSYENLGLSLRSRDVKCTYSIYDNPETK